MNRFSRRALLALSLSLSAMGLTACDGGGSRNGGGGEPDSVASISTNSHTVYVPNGISIDGSVEGDFDSAAIFAGPDALSGAAASKAMGLSLQEHHGNPEHPWRGRLHRPTPHVQWCTGCI